MAPVVTKKTVSHSCSIIAIVSLAGFVSNEI